MNEHLLNDFIPQQIRVYEDLLKIEPLLVKILNEFEYKKANYKIALRMTEVLAIKGVRAYNFSYEIPHLCIKIKHATYRDGSVDVLISDNCVFVELFQKEGGTLDLPATLNGVSVQFSNLKSELRRLRESYENREQMIYEYGSIQKSIENYEAKWHSKVRIPVR